MRTFRIVGTWMLRGLLVLFLLVALDIAALAFPYPLFAHRQEFGEFTVCSSRPIPDGFAEVIEDARVRAAAMEHARPGADYRVFVCGDERLYSVFAFLTRKSPHSMAIGLSVFRNMYLNEPKIRRVGAHNALGIRHAYFEGDLAEVIAHEIAHANVVERLGYWRALSMAEWKSEGYAEYQANRAAKRADDSYAFADRVAIIHQGGIFASGAPLTVFNEQILKEAFDVEVKIHIYDNIPYIIAFSHSKPQFFVWTTERHR